MNILNLKYSKVWQALLNGRTFLHQIDSRFNSSVLLRSFAKVQRLENNDEDKGLPAPPRGFIWRTSTFKLPSDPKIFYTSTASDKYHVWVEEFCVTELVYNIEGNGQRISAQSTRSVLNPAILICFWLMCFCLRARMISLRNFRNMWLQIKILEEITDRCIPVKNIWAT